MKQFKKSSIIIILFGILAIPKLNAQYAYSASRWYGGGTFGLTFGTITSVTIMPEAAYAVTDDFFAGGGVRFSYYSDKTYVPAYESTIWGGKLFLRYYLFSDFFAHIEYQRLYFKDPFYTSPVGKEWTYDDYFYGGGGYRSWIGSNSFMTFELLFNLTRLDEISFGTNPFIRIGFGVGF